MVIKIESFQEKVKTDKDSMTQEAIQKLSTVIRDKDLDIERLSKVIRDKDLEIEGFKSRNESLVQLVQNNDHKLTSSSNSHINEKSVMDNSNEIIILKSKIGELEKKLSLAEVKVEMQDASLAFNRQSRRRYHSTSSEPVENQDWKLLMETLTKEKDAILKEKLDLDHVIACHEEELRNLKRKSESLEHHLAASEKLQQEVKLELEQCQSQLKAKSNEVGELNSSNDRLKLELDEKKHDLIMAQKNLSQLKEMVEEKSSTSENHQQERLHNIAGNIPGPCVNTAADS